jgi:hypothetical protein
MGVVRAGPCAARPCLIMWVWPVDWNRKRMARDQGVVWSVEDFGSQVDQPERRSAWRVEAGSSNPSACASLPRRAGQSAGSNRRRLAVWGWVALVVGTAVVAAGGWSDRVEVRRYDPVPSKGLLQPLQVFRGHFALALDALRGPATPSG